MKRSRNSTVEFLKKNNIPLTRENWLRFECAGNPPAEIDGELEAEIPREIIAAEKRALRKVDRKFLRVTQVAALCSRNLTTAQLTQIWDREWARERDDNSLLMEDKGEPK
jgi:hypothetical protein